MSDDEVKLARADVPARVGDDPDRGEDVDDVDGGRLRLRHVQDYEEDEDLAGGASRTSIKYSWKREK